MTCHIDNYTEFETENGVIYIKDDAINKLAKVDTIVFDCDGVLIDVRNAYNVAIAATTQFIIEALTGNTIPNNLFDSELNHAFKRTGGFNNDWTHAYAIIMRILAELPKETLNELNKYAEECLEFKTPKSRFDHLSGKIKFKISTDGLYEKLIRFATQLDSTGIESVDNLLLSRVGLNIKRAFKFKGEVGESIISTLFEELFLGASLFKESFGIDPSFQITDEGIVEADEVVIREETLDELEDILGGPRFGIASGSLENTAKHVLKRIKERFPHCCQYWHDVVDRDAKMFGNVDLHKPNPYPLIKASEPYNPVNVLFIGDTMADYLTAENAGNKYFFAGVYGCVHNGEEVKNSFLKLGCPVVAPTVNEIPFIFQFVKDFNEPFLS